MWPWVAGGSGFVLLLVGALVAVLVLGPGGSSRGSWYETVTAGAAPEDAAETDEPARVVAYDEEDRGSHEPRTLELATYDVDGKTDAVEVDGVETYEVQGFGDVSGAGEYLVVTSEEPVVVDADLEMVTELDGRVRGLTLYR